MAIKLIDKIAFDDGKFKFNFLVNNPITVIGGDSSSGKSLFFNKLSVKSKVEGIDTFRFVNYMTEDIGSILKLYKNKVIVIDNADAILSDDDIKYIIKDKYNQYVIFSRFVWKFNVDRHAISIIYEPKQACFELLYLARPKAVTQ